MAGHNGVGDHSHHAADEPVQGQSGGNGEADPQRHQGHHPHHDLHGLVLLGILGSLLVLNALLVGDDGVVGLLADDHLQQLTGGRGQGDEERTDVRPIPHPAGREDIELGHCAQVNAQKIEIDAGENDLADAGDGGAQLRCILRNQLRGDDLLVGSIGSEHIRRSRLNDLHDLLRRVGGLHQDVGDGLADNGEQGKQNQNRNEAPQAAAAHGNALGFLKFLNGLILTLGVVRVFLLDGLHLGRQTGHLHHALLGLRVQGQQDQLHDDGEQDHGDAVVVGRFIQD